MPMNWHQRHHGWTCRDCGTFNPNENSVCDGDECRAEQRREERARLRYAIADRIWDRDEMIVRAENGSHRYRARRYVGGKVRFMVLTPFPGLSYAAEWWRVPSSVRWAATAFFW